MLCCSEMGRKCYWTSLLVIFHFSNCWAKKTRWGRMLGESPTFSAPLNRHPQKFSAPFEDDFPLKIHAPLLSLFDGIPQTFSTFMAKSDGWIIFLVDFDFSGPSVPTTAEFLVVFLNSYPPAAMMDSPKLFGKMTLLLYSRASFCSIFLREASSTTKWFDQNQVVFPLIQ